MSEHAIPLTEPGPNWSQREYVACLNLGIGFAAHRLGALMQVFHYGFPEDIGCASVIVGRRWVEQRIYHEFGPLPLDWIERCRKAIGDRP